MACFFEEIYLDESQFIDQFEEIMEGITDETATIWIIDHKVALIPIKLYEEMTRLPQLVDITAEAVNG